MKWVYRIAKCFVTALTFVGFIITLACAVYAWPHREAFFCIVLLIPSAMLIGVAASMLRDDF